MVADRGRGRQRLTGSQVRPAVLSGGLSRLGLAAPVFPRIHALRHERRGGIGAATGASAESQEAEMEMFLMAAIMSVLGVAICAALFAAATHDQARPAARPAE